MVMAVLSLCIMTAAAEGLQRDVLVLFTSDVHCGMDQGFTFAGLKAMKDTAESAGFLHASGLTHEIHTYIESTCTKDGDGLFSGVAGERRVKNVMIGGEPLDPEKTYTVAGSSYLLEDHGDGQTAFDGAKILREADGNDFELLVDYIRGPLGGVIGPEYENPYGQERIVAVEAAPEQ